MSAIITNVVIFIASDNTIITIMIIFVKELDGIDVPCTTTVMKVKQYFAYYYTMFL